MSDKPLSTLRLRVFRAGGWSMLGYGTSQALRLTGNLVMTRLLVPELFGVMAILYMLTTIIWMLSDVGVTQNIIQSRRGDDPVFLDSAWTVQVIRGGVLWLILLLLSFGLHVGSRLGVFAEASVYAVPVLPLIVAIGSFSVVIQSFQSTKMATALRQFNQKRLIQIELISQIVALVTMITIGIATRSIWALVAGSIGSALTTTMLSHIWVDGHANRFRLERSALKELIRYGKWIFISSILFVLAVNGDRLLLGAFVDARYLGLYAIAMLIISSIERGLARLLDSVSLSAFSEIAKSDPSRLRAAHSKFCLLGGGVSLFLAGLLFATGQHVIDVLYDRRYSAAGEVIQILALSLIVVRHEVSRQLYLALGVPRYGTVISFVRFVSLYTLVPALYIYAGPHAALWGIALHAFSTIPFYYFFNARLGVADFRLELMTLAMLPIGLLCGFALNIIVSKW